MNVVVSRNALWAGLTLAVMLLTGCTTPVSRVHFTPFPSPSEKTEKVDIDDPVIRQATAIIDSVLRNNGYETRPNSVNGGNSDKGWFIHTTYNRGSDTATMYNGGRKISTSGFPAGKGSVEIYVVFTNPMRWFVKMNPKVLSVRDQVAEKLAGEFGKEKVAIADSKELVQLN